VEFALLTALGLALPFGNFPLVVWRRFGVDSAHLLAGALVLAAAVRWIRGEREPRRPPGVIWCAALLVIPLLVYSFRRLPGFSAAAFWRTYLHLAFWLLVFLVISSRALSERQFSRMLALLASEGLILGLYGAWQTVAFSRGWPTGVALLNHFARRPLRGGLDLGVWRATATFEEPKWLAIFLSYTAVFSYALAIRSRARCSAIAAAGWLAALLAIALCAVFTVSVGGIAGMAILLAAMAVHFVATLRNRRALALALCAGVMLAGLVWIWTAGEGARKLLRVRVEAAMENLPWQSGPGASYTSGWRYERNARYAMKMIGEAPLLGIGTGQFAPVGAVRGPALGFSPRDTRDAWVGWIAWTAEMGLAGAAILAALLVAIARRSARVVRPALNPYAVLAWFLILAVVAKEGYSAFYMTFWTWYPLGLAALSALIAGDWPKSDRLPDRAET
jgi:hypothetical protein